MVLEAEDILPEIESAGYQVPEGAGRRAMVGTNRSGYPVTAQAR